MTNLWNYFDAIEVITIPDSKNIPGLLESTSKIGIPKNKINIRTFEKTGDGVNKITCSKFKWHFKTKTSNKVINIKEILKYYLKIEDDDLTDAIPDFASFMAIGDKKYEA